MKKKRNTIIAAIVAVFVVAGICGWWLGYQKPHNEAVTAWQAAAAKVNAKNKEFDEAMSKASKLVESRDDTFNPQTKKDAAQTIEDAKKARRDVGEQPKSTDELKQRTRALNKLLDYTDQIDALEQASVAVNNGIRQLKQVTNPSQDFVIARIGTVPGVTGTAAVTEDNDPNDQLNKQGGYTSSVYFSHSSVDPSDVCGTDLIDQGTDAGGDIETFRTAEDAKRRETYLAAFDGTGLASGSHTVVGTVLVRVSSRLNATQQQTIQQQVIDALTRLE